MYLNTKVAKDIPKLNLLISLEKLVGCYFYNDFDKTRPQCQ